MSNSNDDSYLEQSVGELLNKPVILKAIKEGILAWTRNQPHEMKYKFQQMYLSYTLAVVVLVIIVIAGFYGVISKEVTAGLLGSLIGYWYGSRGKQN